MGSQLSYCIMMILLAVLPVASAWPQDIKVMLLGTGAGPPVRLHRFGPSTLIEAGNERLLFDCGRGVTIRLTELGVPPNEVNRLFLTHLHSDHVIDIPDLYLTPWASPVARKVPFQVCGPSGTRDMMDHIQRAFAFDIHIRRDVDEGFSKEGIEVIANDIAQGTVFEQNGVKVTAFLVDHGPVKPAFGYRVDYKGRSVVLSGDTRFSENLIKFSKGTDVLIHEGMDSVDFRARAKQLTPDQAERIIAHHSLPEQAGEVFARVKPRLAVYSHTAGTDRLMTATRDTYTGRLEMGEDLMTIEIGDSVKVHRFASTTR